MATTWRYKAFISYAHKDTSWARWLHARLEGYKPPVVAGDDSPRGQPLKPVFRDRDELPASGHLSPLLTDALEQSEFLIVLCSPASAQSRWVNQEIEHFRRERGAENILALIVDGEPHSGGEDDCFPPALLAEDEEGNPIEPVAADARPLGDGKRLAFLKLAAGLLRTPLDKLAQRDNARRNKRLAMLTAGSVAGMVGALALAFFAETQRQDAVAQRLLAERNERKAETTKDYLVNIFEVANPETENPNTITALTVLERGAEGIDQLADEPEVQAELFTSLGLIYRQLGLYRQAANNFANARLGLEPGSLADIRVVLEQADLAIQTSDFELAEQVLQSAYDGIFSLGNEESKLKGMAHQSLGQLAREELRLADAIVHFSSARAFYESTDGDLSREIALVTEFLAKAYGLDGNAEQASLEYERALALRRQIYPPGHKKLGIALNNIAYHYFQVGDIEAAETAIAEALAIKTRVLETGHPQVAYAQMMYGQILEAQNKLAEAEEQFRASLDGLETAFPDGHYQRGFAGVYLASVLGKQNRTKEALELLDSARDQYDIGYGKVHANHGDLEIYRAEVLMVAAREAEARAACAKGLEILDETIGLDAAPSIQLAARCKAMGAL
ncbi:MAG: toll/interleukin-1 receptor domain-containing protein [Parvularculaceae bacterium]|nr:toll/interleukin-1 receptor domain-containing protein [Parvularculaceae bacterium]